MAKGMQNKEEGLENLTELLAVAVRSVQWSYAIFWSLSTEQQGGLEWGNGYYNGEIKTMKTVQAVELQADEMGFQRSQQLVELYKSLLVGETEQQAKRPPASLSPEDLTNAEWYYLVCMSFEFSAGQGLPGRALASDQSIWLCNAHCADSKVFTRSLLAKSASIKTVICFPYLGGVIELGVTELVLEDPYVIQHIKTSIMEFLKPNCSEKPTSSHNDGDLGLVCVNFDNIVDTLALEKFYSPAEDIGFDQGGLDEFDGRIHENISTVSPEDCSYGCEHNHRREDLMIEHANEEGSQDQSWHYIDDEFSYCIRASTNSTDCISQVLVHQEKSTSPPKGGENISEHLEFKELQDCNHTKLTSSKDGNDDDLHYRRIVSTVLRQSLPPIKNMQFQSCNHKSSFVRWQNGRMVIFHRPQEQQRMLKRILRIFPSVNSGCALRPQKEDGQEDIYWTEGICAKHAFTEKVTENGKFTILKSTVPSITKIDKTSILGGTMEYLKGLETRVAELESCIDLVNNETRAKAKYSDTVEQTSDNYENRRIECERTPHRNKRKACDIVGIESELIGVVANEGEMLETKVSIEEKEVLIEMRCPWREYLLLDIMDVVDNLNLDAHSIQSFIIDGVLNLTLQSKFQGAEVAPARMIKQALSRIAPGRIDKSNGY